MRLVSALATLGLVMLSVPARAEDTAHDVPLGQTRFRVFAGADGLRNLVITSIAQDASGFLWLATDDGVYRFDGERFTHFSPDDGLLSSLNYVIGIGPDGAPCVGSVSGLVCWNGERFSQERTRGAPRTRTHAIASFAGKLWVGTDTAGLYMQDGARGFIPAPGWPGRPTANIRALWADASGLVVGHDAAVHLTTGDGAWQVLDDIGIGNDRIEGILRDRQGTLWIRTAAHMWILPRGAARATDVGAGLPTGYDMVDSPTAMAIGPRGDVLIGTDAGIAYREDDHWHLINRSVGLPGAATRTLFVDREGTMWIGAAGLFQLRGRDVIERYDVASGLPGEIAWHFHRDPGGTLWVGTNRCAARAIAGRWECLPGSERRTVRTMVFPPQGGVFLGGAPSDLLYIDPEGRATSLSHPDRPPDSHILALALGPEGDLWIGTKGGLFRLPGAVPGPLEHIIIPGVRPRARILSLAVVDGRLWAGSENGVIVRDGGAWHVFDQRAGLRVTAVSYLAPRADGRMCVAYREAIGLSCFRYDRGELSAFEHIGPAQGLTTGMVYLLGEDRQRRLWIGTGDGIDVVTPRGIDHFDESDGLAGNDSTATAFMLDRDGSLWTGSSGGATHVLAQYYEGPPLAPRTAFLDGRLGDRAIGSAHAALEVPHDHNALTLEFASSSMLDAKRVEYQVRLSPLEAAWSTMHQRQVRYPALLPGAYRFEVRARIGAGSWGPTTALGFAVLPAWWQTRWFIVLATAIGLGALAAVFTWRAGTVLRQRTRQLHDRTDASFRAVTDLMPELISVYRDRKLIYLNLANRRFLGLDGDDDRWKRLQPLDRVHPDDRAMVAELFRRVSDGDEASAEVFEVRVQSADGSWRACELSAVLVDLGGAPTVVASSRDVTERKRIRAKLLVTDRMASLGTLAAGIAHEINNPLAYVAGNLEAMAETFQTTRCRPSEAECVELSAAVNDARDGAERVRKIVHGLRSFSRSEDEKRTPLALASVLEAAIRLTGNEVRHRAQLVRELGPVPLVVADDGRLTQVFINLLVNAAHAIPEGHSDDNRITVRTRTDDAGRAVVEIADTGTGMPPEICARVFDPFFTTKDVGEGTGLGLSICHGIVSGLGGQIALDSTPGHGTTVRIVLPPHTSDDAPALARAPISKPPPSRNGLRRQRVMLVDDEPQVAHTMERLLRRDYDVTIAACGRDALAHISQGARFDAIVSDVMMPNMTGIELVEELQRIAPDQAQRLIFLSGGAFTAQTRERLDQLGALQLEKPITASKLRACVLQVAADNEA